MSTRQKSTNSTYDHKKGGAPALGAGARFIGGKRLMKRIGFKMKLHAGHAAEYKKRHDEIWPELSEVITRSGARDYSIFHDPETDILFGVLYVPDDAGLGDPGSEPIVRKWWDFMSDIMDTNPDNSPVQKPLVEVFHMD